MTVVRLVYASEDISNNLGSVNDAVLRDQDELYAVSINYDTVSSVQLRGFDLIAMKGRNLDFSTHVELAENVSNHFPSIARVTSAPNYDVIVMLAT